MDYAPTTRVMRVQGTSHAALKKWGGDSKSSNELWESIDTAPLSRVSVTVEIDMSPDEGVSWGHVYMDWKDESGDITRRLLSVNLSELTEGEWGTVWSDWVEDAFHIRPADVKRILAHASKNGW